VTQSEIVMAKALNQCTFVPGTGTKSFAKFAANLAEHFPDRELTFGQKKYLSEAVIKFRRQIKTDVVDIARKASDELS